MDFLKAILFTLIFVSCVNDENLDIEYQEQLKVNAILEIKSNESTLRCLINNTVKFNSKVTPDSTIVENASVVLNGINYEKHANFSTPYYTIKDTENDITFENKTNLAIKVQDNQTISKSVLLIDSNKVNLHEVSLYIDDNKKELKFLLNFHTDDEVEYGVFYISLNYQISYDSLGTIITNKRTSIFNYPNNKSSEIKESNFSATNFFNYKNFEENIDLFPVPILKFKILKTTIGLSSISKDLYDFEKTSEQNQYLQNDPFAEPVSVFSNIENGLGIFGVKRTQHFEFYSQDSINTN